MPFGDQHLDGYYQKAIKPAVEELGITVVRADNIYRIRPVIEDIFEGIKNADVTGKNPNVNYELGAAHIINKNVIIIAQSMEDCPLITSTGALLSMTPKGLILPKSGRMVFNVQYANWIWMGQTTHPDPAGLRRAACPILTSMI